MLARKHEMIARDLEQEQQAMPDLDAGLDDDIGDELLRLIEELPEEEVSAVLDDVRRHLRSVRERPWPPAWFGAGEGSADDVAARSEDLLRDGFGRSA